MLIHKECRAKVQLTRVRFELTPLSRPRKLGLRVLKTLTWRLRPLGHLAWCWTEISGGEGVYHRSWLWWRDAAPTAGPGTMFVTPNDPCPARQSSRMSDP